jgi:hypothetical protein
VEERVKLPSSGYTELSKIIAGYAKIDREASLDDISKLLGMNPTGVSGNNGFLLGVGVIEGASKKKVTPIGRQLGLAIEHQRDEDINSLWRDIVTQNTFLQNLISAVRIRRGMDAGSLRAHVAYSAGLAKTKAVMAGAGTVVEILKRSGFLEEQDGKLVAVAEQQVSDAQPPQEGAPVPEDALVTQVVHKQVFAARPQSGLVVSIRLQINCTPNELDGLGSVPIAALNSMRRCDSP